MLLMHQQPLFFVVQAILQVMVIVSFGFVLTKMGYFTMEKQKVFVDHFGDARRVQFIWVQ